MHCRHPALLGIFGGCAGDYGDQIPQQAVLGATTGIQGRDSRHLAVLLPNCARGSASSPRREGDERGRGAERAWESRGTERLWSWGGGVIGILRSPPRLGSTQGPPPGTRRHIHRQQRWPAGPLCSWQRLCLAHWFAGPVCPFTGPPLPHTTSGESLTRFA